MIVLSSGDTGKSYSPGYVSPSDESRHERSKGTTATTSKDDTTEASTVNPACGGVGGEQSSTSPLSHQSAFVEFLRSMGVPNVTCPKPAPRSRELCPHSDSLSFLGHYDSQHLDQLDDECDQSVPDGRSGDTSANSISNPHDPEGDNLRGKTGLSTLNSVPEEIVSDDIKTVIEKEGDPEPDPGQKDSPEINNNSEGNSMTSPDQDNTVSSSWEKGIPEDSQGMVDDINGTEDDRNLAQITEVDCWDSMSIVHYFGTS